MAVDKNNVEYADAVKDKLPYTIDQKGCARCHGDGHAELTFRPLTYAYEDPDGWIGTHWAPCPANGEPIILGWDPAKQAADWPSGRST